MKIDKTHSFLNLLVDIEFGADLLALFAIFADTAECNSTTLKSCNNGKCHIQNHEAVCVCDEGKFCKIIIHVVMLHIPQLLSNTGVKDQSTVKIIKASSLSFLRVTD